MSNLLRRFLFVLSMLLPLVAPAQTICPPSGVNAYGARCDPSSGGLNEPQSTQPGGQTTPSVTHPGQNQYVSPPAIANRAPATIQPGGQDGLGRNALPGVPGMPDGRPIRRAERNEFQDLVLQSIGRDLPMFGYNLFQQPPSTFAPLDRVPVTPDYVLGPGDELLIRAWGGVDIDYRVVVERDGMISIPRVGSVSVAGLRFRDLQAHLNSAIGKSFKNFELSVTMGQLRSIHIFVVGEAASPGAYTVSSLSTLVNALFASGGPTTKGSMRAIQLKRRDKIVTQFDVYDLLVRGDKSKDVPLVAGDVIYIPPIGPLAAVAGSVNKPAIYELTEGTSMSSLLELAGGLATTADGQKITVERIASRKGREVEEFSLDAVGLAHPVRDGDLVQIQRLSPRFSNVITVRGNVAVPARHPWRSGLRVRDVVPDRESLIVPDYWVRRNLIVRPDIIGRTDFGLRMDLAEDLRLGSALPDMHRGASDTPDAMALRQSGRPAQTRPELAPRTDVRAPAPEVNWDYAVIERLNRDDLTTHLVPFNLGKAVIEGDPQHNLLLEPGDIVTIFSKDDFGVPVAKQTTYVKLEGEFVTPGVYQVRPGETLRQLITRVGGFSPNAYVFGSTFTRESTRIMQQKRLDEMVDRLEQEVHRNVAQTSLTSEDSETKKSAAQGQIALIARLRQVRATGRIVLKSPETPMNLATIPELALEHGDTLRVPPLPSTVAVLGTVYNENAYIYNNGMRVADYLAQAGGPTKDADSGSFYVIRADGTVISKRQSGGFLGFGGFEGERVLPGDTIIVPEKLDKYRLTREFKDWSQIFYQFALGVAGLKVLSGL